MWEKLKSKVQGNFTKIRETGNNIIWFVFMTPLFVALIGVAVDTSAATAMKNNLQNALDAASQSTLALSRPLPGAIYPSLPYNEAYTSFLALYDENRVGIDKRDYTDGGVKFLSCSDQRDIAGTNEVLIFPQMSGCPFVLKDFNYIPDGGLGTTMEGYLTATVAEKIPTMFLSFLGINEITVTSTTTARLTYSFD